MAGFMLRSALAGSALLALAACAASDEYYPTATAYPSGTLVTAPGTAVAYPPGTTVYYPPATAAVPPRAATDPSAYDATRRNSQSVGAGVTRMGNSVPMEGGGGN
jgi:hypothetical protein